MCTTGGSGTAIGWGATTASNSGAWVAHSVTGEFWPFQSEVAALRKALTLPAGGVVFVPWGESIAGAISGDI